MKITKRQLRRIIKEEKAKVLAEKKVRRIVRRRLIEMAGGVKTVSTDQGGYTDGKGYVTNAQDHSLDQLQDLIDMGVQQVVDSDASGETIAMKDWIPIVVDAARENNEDRYGKPERWKGGLTESKRRRRLRRLLENVMRPSSPAELLDMIKGREADLSLGGSGMVIYLDGNYQGGYINAENALDQMFNEMGPEEAIEALRSSASMLEIDEDTMMELGLDE
tara:strand:- start:380 stop:1039 length:660 start_codon:yes stop_codon:yes gene_type:complete